MVIGFIQRSTTVSEGTGFPENVFNLSIGVDTLSRKFKPLLFCIIIVQLLLFHLLVVQLYKVMLPLVPETVLVTV